MHIGALTLYFSYASCIAFETPTLQLYHPHYRGDSPAVAAQIAQAQTLGCADFPDAFSEADFRRALGAALACNALA
jgi:hypothetical protein